MPFLLVWLVALFLAANPRPASATGGSPDTIAVVGDASRPVLALEPGTGVPHVAYISNATLYHAWKSDGTWQSEPIASPVGYISSTTQYGGFDLQVAPDGRVFALFIRQEQLECAVRESGVWLSDTLDVLPGPRKPLSLAVSQVTGEPTAAWTKAGAPGAPAEIKFARRSAGSWTTQLLDTVSTASLTVGVAVDLADRPRAAWGRPRADANPGQVLTIALASGPAGPWVTAAVDSQLADHLTLAVDPADGEPRLVYETATTPFDRFARYAARDAGLIWQSTPVRSVPNNRAGSSALALDPAGNPFVAVLDVTPIAPSGIQAGDPPNLTNCFYTATTSIILLRREGGAGAGPFQAFGNLALPNQYDVASGPRALASSQAGVVDVAWRYPAITCSPYAVSMTRRTPFAGVTPGSGARVAMSAVSPNPALVGGPLHVTFQLEQDADVAMELRDVAGRRVAEHGLGRLGPGVHERDWEPAAPRAGVYWLTVRANGERLGTRQAVLVR